MPNTIPWDKIIGFGLVVLGIAAGIIPGLDLPTGSSMSMITGGLVLLGISHNVNTLGRKMGAQK